MQTGWATSAEAAERRVLLQPRYNGPVSLLGQTAGWLRLARAGSDPDRLREQLGVVLRRWRELQDGVAGDLTFRPKTGHAVVESVTRLGALLDRLEQRFSQSMRDDAELSAMLGELAGIRRLLHGASCPQHGLVLVDFSGACCAGAH